LRTAIEFFKKIGGAPTLRNGETGNAGFGEMTAMGAAPEGQSFLVSSWGNGAFLIGLQTYWHGATW